MAEMQIKTESQPARCEICHQTDYFDANINYCSRCSNIAMEKKDSNSIKAGNVSTFNAATRLALWIGCGIIVGAISIGILSSISTTFFPDPGSNDNDPIFSLFFGAIFGAFLGA